AQPAADTRASRARGARHPADPRARRLQSVRRPRRARSERGLRPPANLRVASAQRSGAGRPASPRPLHRRPHPLRGGHGARRQGPSAGRLRAARLLPQLSPGDRHGRAGGRRLAELPPRGAVGGLVRRRGRLPRHLPRRHALPRRDRRAHPEDDLARRGERAPAAHHPPGETREARRRGRAPDVRTFPRDVRSVRRAGRIVGAALCGLAVAGMTAWAALAIRYSDLPSARILGALFAVGTLLAFVLLPRRRRTLVGFLIVFALIVVWWRHIP